MYVEAFELSWSAINLEMAPFSFVVFKGHGKCHHCLISPNCQACNEKLHVTFKLFESVWFLRTLSFLVASLKRTEFHFIFPLHTEDKSANIFLFLKAKCYRAYTVFNAKMSCFIWDAIKKPFVSAHLERLTTLNIAYWPKCCLGLGQRAKFTRSFAEVSDYRPVCNFRPLGYPTVRISRWYYSLLVWYIQLYLGNLRG